MATLDRQWPTWLRDIDSLLAVHPHFVLSSNVRDWYRLPTPTPRLVPSAAAAIHAALSPSGFDVLLLHDMVDGFSVLTSDGDNDAGWAAVQAVITPDLRTPDAGRDLSVVSGVVRTMAESDPLRSRRLGLVLNDASRLINRLEDLQPQELDLFRVASKVSRQAKRPMPGETERYLFNPVFWLVDREHDLPAWFTAGNPGVRAITVPYPDLAERAAVASMLIGKLDGGRDPATVAGELAAGTDGLGASALVGLVSLFDDQALSYEEIDDAIRMYKVGAAESPWRQGLVARRLRGNSAESEPDGAAALGSQVLGQPRAVTKAVDILTRAVLGLSGAQGAPLSSRPRGVLFLVGPTGTGKTELAKALTRLVFGTSDAYVRFDMSEFAAEHSGDRLIGAPPGYVGFDAGGELTNAVRARPQSLLLFDEIEKAHPLILDKFLQILEDGRLTDGRGTTVHFSETLIVFTSNIGTYRLAEDGKTREPNISPSDDYETIEKQVRTAVQKYFSEHLNRPELLNRIGENIVVFDFIRPDVADEIVDLQIRNVIRRVDDAVGATITLAPEALAQIHALATADPWFGGRGIGNLIESRFVNPLARALFAVDVQPGQRLTATSVHQDSSGPVVEFG